MKVQKLQSLTMASLTSTNFRDYIKEVHLEGGYVRLKLRGNCRICGAKFEKEIRVRLTDFLKDYPQNLERILERHCTCKNPICELTNAFADV